MTLKKRYLNKDLILIGLFLFMAQSLHARVVYFVVTEIYPLHNDSFMVAITEPSDIEHARDLITKSKKTLATIVVAKIAEGSIDPWGVINEGMYEPSGSGTGSLFVSNEPIEWAWHVSGFIGFADNTIEILDGWPSFVEDDLSGWIANTNSTIGFWSYTITEELFTIYEAADCDLNDDNVINLVDVAMMAQCWQANSCDKSDINQDGITNVLDLEILITHWLAIFD